MIDRYISNRANYFRLKDVINQSGGYYGFGMGIGYYVIHSASSVSSMISALTDGYLAPGNQVEPKYRMSSGGEPLRHIYANINFDDIHNIDSVGGIKYYFHPDVLKDFNVTFNRGWFKYPMDGSVVISKNDTDKQKENAIQEIKEYVRNPTFYEKIGMKRGPLTHELMFDEIIPFDKYLMGIQCEGCSKSDVEKIRKIMNKYPNAKFLELPRVDGKVMPPMLSDMIDVREL